MIIQKFTFIVLSTLALTSLASAKSFNVQLSANGENADGNYTTTSVPNGITGITSYELIPATVAAAYALEHLTCPTGHRVEASVLERRQAFDAETQKSGAKTLKLLVRRVRCQSMD